MLEAVTKEKEGAKEKLEEALGEEKGKAQEREMALRREFSAKLGELEEQYNGLRAHVEEESGQLGPENEVRRDILK